MKQLSQILINLIAVSYLSLSFGYSYYQVDSTQSYHWKGAYPQSCECMENGVPKSKCKLFRCPCSCDVTAGVCDYSCCCDPDCSSDQKSRFTELNVCLDAPDISEQYECYSSDQLLKINPRPPLHTEPTAERALGDALCVVKSNRALLEEYYETSGVLSSGIFQKEAGQKPYNYLPSKTTGYSFPDPYYDQGNPIASFLAIPSTSSSSSSSSSTSSVDLVSVGMGGGYWSLPRSTSSGLCSESTSEGEVVGFEKESQTHCLRPVPVLPLSPAAQTQATADFTAQCQSAWSSEALLSKLRLAKSGSLTPSSSLPASLSNTLPVSLHSLSFEDPLSGLRLPLSLDWMSTHCPSRSSPSSSTSLSLSLHSSLTSLQTDWNHSDCNPARPHLSTLLSLTSNPPTTPLPPLSSLLTPSLLSQIPLWCMGAVREVRYTLYHNASGPSSLTQLLADVVLTNLPLLPPDLLAYLPPSPPYPSPTPTPSPALSPEGLGLIQSGRLLLPQSFGVHFVSESSSPSSSKDLGNVVRRRRSGNPGYQIGLPLLFGQLSSSSEVVFESMEGFSVPSVGQSGLCPLGGQAVGHRGVSFGFDLSAGCLLRLTRNDLSSLCTALSSASYASSPLIGPSGLPHFFNFSDGVVGMYGNADPLDPAQWLPLTRSPYLSQTSWNPRTSTCSNLPTSLNFQFLVSDSGQRAHSQRKVVSALASLGTADWRMSSLPLDVNASQPFQLSVTVSFVSLGGSGQRLNEYTPPAPPVLFKVPYDVFYPFYINSSPPSPPPSSRLGLASVCVLALSFLLSLSLL